MVLGGTGIHTAQENTVELKSLSPEDPLPESLRSPLNNFPIYTTGAVGMFLGESQQLC